MSIFWWGDRWGNENVSEKSDISFNKHYLIDSESTDAQIVVARVTQVTTFCTVAPRILRLFLGYGQFVDLWVEV
jgi:hypothetical protein